MTLDDQKASKKFVCASELARVFKSMICLFLTTSFLFINMKSDGYGLLMMEDEGYDDFDDATTEPPLLQQSPTAYAEDVMRRSVAGASAASADDIMIEGGEGRIGDSES